MAAHAYITVFHLPFTSPVQIQAYYKVWFPCRKNPRPSEILLFPDRPRHSPTQGGNGRHLPPPVFISREGVVRSGNNKIPDGLGFSRHMKTGVYNTLSNGRTCHCSVLREDQGWETNLTAFRQSLFEGWFEGLAKNRLIPQSALSTPH